MRSLNELYNDPMYDPSPCPICDRYEEACDCVVCNECGGVARAGASFCELCCKHDAIKLTGNAASEVLCCPCGFVLPF